MTASFLNAGSAHDDVCMRLFAAGLLAAGLKDEAAAVYYSLLQGGSDRAQQVALFTLHLTFVCLHFYWADSALQLCFETPVSLLVMQAEGLQRSSFSLHIIMHLLAMTSRHQAELPQQH